MDLHDMRVDTFNWLGVHAQAAADTTGDLLLNYPGPITIACAIVGSGVMTYAVLRWKERHPKKPIATPTAQDLEDMKRRAQLEQIYADKFGDVMFDMLMAGEIDGKEYKRDIKRFGLAYRLGDLLRRNNHIRAIVVRVRKNCAEMHRTPSMKGKVPGPDTVKAVPPPLPVAQRKTWVVLGKAKLRLKSAS